MQKRLHAHAIGRDVWNFIYVDAHVRHFGGSILLKTYTHLKIVCMHTCMHTCMRTCEHVEHSSTCLLTWCVRARTCQFYVRIAAQILCMIDDRCTKSYTRNHIHVRGQRLREAVCVCVCTYRFYACEVAHILCVICARCSNHGAIT
jgi:hypothetical protein